MTNRVLLVDDESLVLDGLRRLLRREFEIDTAVGAREALALMESSPYAVVVSDMMMPEIAGPEFLALAAKIQPDAVQMILSGQADLASTVRAVNSGNIFRFLLKPAGHEDLSNALNAALEQYRLRTVERDLLKTTLAGAVEALSELLTIASPVSARRAGLVRLYAQRAAPAANLGNDWQLEIAAMVANIGLMAVPDEILTRISRGIPISEAEQAMMRRHPIVAAQILAHIPRLDGVAEIVRNQHARNSASVRSELQPHAVVIQLATEITERIMRGISADDSIAIAERSGRYEQRLIDGVRVEPIARTNVQVAVRELRTGMTFCDDLCTPTGTIIVAAGTTLTPTLVERIRNFAAGIGVAEPIDVQSARELSPI